MNFNNTRLLLRTQYIPKEGEGTFTLYPNDSGPLWLWVYSHSLLRMHIRSCFLLSELIFFFWWDLLAHAIEYLCLLFLSNVWAIRGPHSVSKEHCYLLGYKAVYSAKVNRRFGGTYRFHFYVRGISRTGSQCRSVPAPAFMHFSRLAYCSALII
jgi:hypothetical protein